MPYARLVLVAVAALGLTGCASVIPQYSDFIYSVELGASDGNTVEVRVTHGLDDNDMAELVWIGRAAYPVAQEHCESVGKTVGRSPKPRSAGSGVTVFAFRCVAAGG